MSDSDSELSWLANQWEKLRIWYADGFKGDEYDERIRRMQSDPTNLRVRVVYCGSCGFLVRAEQAKEELLKRFSQEERPRIFIELEKSIEDDGEFDVYVEDELLHSKNEKRHGFLHNNPAQLDVVTARMRERLQEKLRNKTTASTSS